ncbi:antibiotic biosynthesis monooxygenase [Thalassobaculum sp. OXR-137]|uniref:antibiotic biosynthesis monooxygenase family protein n=1 Tax=Thalassobaculum sp. OXR-137 TaxID=3100173 RepID=UPI002AC9277A|nr:antibiotic biosynthesis monooxygenase [Thalassobaculum sp. OXR-137]WPZ36099.1 antibiotic biosynthesis monooxygenase [Thalassobaculum sp. OXR-137]
MHVVIFEVEPKDGCRDSYFEMAAALRAELQTVEGFISVERFESLVTPGKILSLSTWEDEAAIQRWRERSAHYAAQSAGRDTMFARYRIRVAEVGRDYDRETSPWRT